MKCADSDSVAQAGQLMEYPLRILFWMAEVSYSSIGLI